VSDHEAALLAAVHDDKRGVRGPAIAEGHHAGSGAIWVDGVGTATRELRDISIATGGQRQRHASLTVIHRHPELHILHHGAAARPEENRAGDGFAIAAGQAGQRAPRQHWACAVVPRRPTKRQLTARRATKAKASDDESSTSRSAVWHAS